MIKSRPIGLELNVESAQQFWPDPKFHSETNFGPGTIFFRTSSQENSVPTQNSVPIQNSIPTQNLVPVITFLPPIRLALVMKVETDQAKAQR